MKKIQEYIFLFAVLFGGTAVLGVLYILLQALYGIAISEPVIMVIILFSFASILLASIYFSINR